VESSLDVKRRFLSRNCRTEKNNCGDEVGYQETQKGRGILSVRSTLGLSSKYT